MQYMNMVYVIFLCLQPKLYELRNIPAAHVTVKGLKAPTARIIINVRRKRAKFWDFWQLNSNICPPSLCVADDPSQTVEKPRGTGGSIFYNGDIILDKVTQRYIYGDQSSRRKRAAIKLKDRLWKDGIVYYVFAPELPRRAKKAIRQAMAHISNKTCIQFKKKRNKDMDYIRFIAEPGCWSNIGRVGGEQKLSLGQGCERTGTAIHEIAHALGFWHEQSRPDRDKYVEVNIKNVSPRYEDDFKMINKTLASSRGYAYDYSSIMHYSERTFTNNGLKTIKVIGIGKELALRIGQRDGLSNIDIAQLRDMYFCNRKQDNTETICPKDWIKNKRGCYRFVSRPRLQYAAAQKYCKKFFSKLVHINTKNEDGFLKKYLKENFKKSTVWRVGARRLNETLVWDNGEGRKPIDMKYTAWRKGEPNGYTSVALWRDNTSDDFVWHGVWAGSLAQLPLHTNSFICERKSRRKCLPLEFADGRDYRGTLAHTISGITCQNWTSKYPHRHSLLGAIDTEQNPDGIGDHNFCRNPFRDRKKKPWCYTTKKKIKWQYCDVTACYETLNTTLDKKKNENEKADSDSKTSSKVSSRKINLEKTKTIIKSNKINDKNS